MGRGSVTPGPGLTTSSSWAVEAAAAIGIITTTNASATRLMNLVIHTSMPMPSDERADRSVPLDKPPELLFIEQRDSLALLTQPLDLHQLQPAIATSGLQWIRFSSHDDGRQG